MRGEAGRGPNVYNLNRTEPQLFREMISCLKTPLHVVRDELTRMVKCTPLLGSMCVPHTVWGCGVSRERSCPLCGFKTMHLHKPASAEGLGGGGYKDVANKTPLSY